VPSCKRPTIGDATEFFPQLWRPNPNIYPSSAQRWFDNSFDLEVFGYNWTANGVFQGIAKTGLETAPLPVGTVFTTPQPIGSYPVSTVNVADPAVVNGSVNVSKEFQFQIKEES
jgi:hypothetical protein